MPWGTACLFPIFFGSPEPSRFRPDRDHDEPCSAARPEYPFPFTVGGDLPTGPFSPARSKTSRLFSGNGISGKAPFPDRLQGDRAGTGLRMTALRNVRRTEQKESPQSPRDSGDRSSVRQLILSTLTFDVTLPMTLSGLSDVSVLTSRHLSELSQETRSEPSSALLKRLSSCSPPASIR